jgi:hypothetical protein
MSGRHSEIIILGEDEAQRNFAITYLRKRGFDRRKITATPRQKGGGEASVKQAFPAELKFYRSRRYQQGRALIVLIDADDRSVEDRHQQLWSELRESGLELRAEDERVIILVPRRNIETWVVFLNDGPPVDETTDYKSQVDSKSIRVAGKALAGGSFTKPLPPSLARALRDELPRLPDPS